METQCTNLEWKVQECHQVNPCVTIDLTQGGDGDGYICYPLLIFILDDKMSNKQVTTLYNEAIQLAGGEDTYVPGVDELVPIHEEPLRVWEGINSAHTAGRDPWEWSVSGPGKMMM